MDFYCSRVRRMLRTPSPLQEKCPKSEGPPATPEETPFHQDLYCQIASKSRILDSDYNDFRRRFQLCSPQVLNPRPDGSHPLRFCKIIGNLGKMRLEIKCYLISWCQMSSLVTPDASADFPTCPGSISRTLISHDFWWILGVLMWGLWNLEKSDMVRSTLLQGTRFRNQGVLTQVGERPLFTKSPMVNRIQMKHSRH